jgi:hypothetical protein
MMDKKMETAMQVAGFDTANIDLPLLVGALLRIKQWAESEHHLTALGKQSFCDEMRKAGNKLLD